MHTTRTTVPPLSGLAKRALGDLDRITDEFIGQARRIHPYNNVSAAELRFDTQRSLEFLIRLMGGLPVPDQLAAASSQIGRARARAGVPLEAVLQAVRLDIRVLWNHVTRSAGEAEKDLLLEWGNLVWEAVERHTLSIQASYLDEEALIAREGEDLLGRLIHRLMATRGLEPQVVMHVRTALDARPAGGWVVARSAPEHDTRLSAEAARLRSLHTSAHMETLDGLPLFLAQLPPGASRMPTRWLRGVPCGFAIASTLETVPAAADTAAAVAAVMSAESKGPRGLRDTWTAIVVDRLADMQEPLTREVLRDLLEVSPEERDRLVATAREFFQAGTINATCAAMYCHRNTVMNRLNRLRDLTGFDITKPGDAAPVLLALSIAC